MDNKPFKNLVLQDLVTAPRPRRGSAQRLPFAKGLLRGSVGKTCACTQLCTYVCICAGMHECTHLCMCICTYEYTYVHVLAYTHTHACKCEGVCKANKHMNDQMTRQTNKWRSACGQVHEKWASEQMDGCMDGWMDRLINESMNESMSGWDDERMQHVC